MYSSFPKESSRGLHWNGALHELVVGIEPDLQINSHGSCWQNTRNFDTGPRSSKLVCFERVPALSGIASSQGSIACVFGCPFACFRNGSSSPRRPILLQSVVWQVVIWNSWVGLRLGLVHFLWTQKRMKVLEVRSSLL
jgi:hypothetical protein